MLWRVESPGRASSYLFGTIHVPDPRVTDLPAAVLDALDDCDALFTELDFTQQQNSSLHSEMLRNDSRSLRDILPRDLYRRLKDFLGSKGLAPEMFKNYEVWALDMMLQTFDLKKAPSSGPPLDLALFERARRDDKETGGIETFEEQLAVIGAGSEADQIQVLRHTLETVQKAEAQGTTMLEILIQLYLQGDPDQLIHFMYEAVEPEDVALRKYLDHLLGHRNERMARRAAAKMRADPGRSFFFAFGAAHCPGVNGVVRLLRDRGYKVSRLDLRGKPLAPSGPHRGGLRRAV
jgi:hypothetical protein